MFVLRYFCLCLTLAFFVSLLFVEETLAADPNACDHDVRDANVFVDLKRDKIRWGDVEDYTSRKVDDLLDIAFSSGLDHDGLRVTTVRNKMEHIGKGPCDERNVMKSICAFSGSVDFLVYDFDKAQEFVDLVEGEHYVVEFDDVESKKCQ